MDVAEVKQLMHATLLEKLHGTRFSGDKASTTCKEIVDAIKSKLIAMDSTHYKYIVEARLFEKTGGAYSAHAKCYWDGEKDKHVEEIYQNDSLLCAAAVFAVAL